MCLYKDGVSVTLILKYKISKNDDQYMKNQYQHVSKNNSDYNYIDEKHIQNIFVEKTIQNQQRIRSANMKKITFEDRWTA